MTGRSSRGRTWEFIRRLTSVYQGIKFRFFTAPHAGHAHWYSGGVHHLPAPGMWPGEKKSPLMDSLPELSARKLGTTSITLIDSRTQRVTHWWVLRSFRRTPWGTLALFTGHPLNFPLSVCFRFLYFCSLGPQNPHL